MKILHPNVVKFFHILGLTNLSQKEVNEYYGLYYRSKIENTNKKAQLLWSQPIIIALIGAGAIIIAAVIPFILSPTIGMLKNIICNRPPQCPSGFVGPGLIEAEDCYREGRWRAWDSGEFSNGRLINNEDPNHMGQPSDLYLCLNFEGTGVIIVYRQDTWYGSLAVEIDGRRVESINQGGGVRNQTERYFYAGGRGKHSLFLRGTRATGVITIDAIRIIGDQHHP